MVSGTVSGIYFGYRFGFSELSLGFRDQGRAAGLMFRVSGIGSVIDFWCSRLGFVVSSFGLGYRFGCSYSFQLFFLRFWFWALDFRVRVSGIFSGSGSSNGADVTRTYLFFWYRVRVSELGYRSCRCGSPQCASPITWFRVSGFGFRVSGFGFRVSGFGFRVSGFGFRVSDFGFRVKRL
jgi:hypothetical protein